MSLRYRAVFVSDVHLGSAGSMVGEFVRFLSAVQCEQLYLVGDILDIWMIMKAGKWQQEHTEALELLLNRTKVGVQVYYTPGNHDAFMRNVNNSTFGNLKIAHSFDYTTFAGRRFLVVHGDLFDKSVRVVPVAWMAAWCYECLTVINHRWNSRRLLQGKGKVEFSSVFKKRLKRFIGRRTDFAEILLEEAVSRGYDGVVCGHIHKGQIREDADGKTYINTGDWVEHGNAVVEHLDGRLELLSWREIQGLLDEQDRIPLPDPLAKDGGFLECVPGTLNPSA